MWRSSIVLERQRQNCMHEEFKTRINSQNGRYQSVKNILSSYLISKNINIKIYRTIILPALLYGCETWSRELRE
jgi:hypothetical protein